MNITEKLDLAIKSNETGTTDGAYTLSHKGSMLRKVTYMTNDEWAEFFKTMPTKAYEEYNKSADDILFEKNGQPPKMASYGSAKRMIYNLSRDIEGFHFEKKLPATIGGKTSIDGFCEYDNRYAFVEAKCHEPYSMRRNSSAMAYSDLYNYINERMIGQIQIETRPSTCGRYLNADYFAYGERLERFDMKQTVCHLLGIAGGLLNGTFKRKQIDYIYLLYDPTELDLEPDLKYRVDEIYERICYECNLVEIPELFRVILEFLNETKFGNSLSYEDIDDIIFKFTFTLSSQEFYPILMQ